MTDWFFRGDFAPTPTDVPALLMALLLAFACGHALAWIYMLTHSGLSYSRSFVNSLVVIPTVVAMVMTVLNNNLITAFGLMAVFAIVRFRNILRDTLDSSYILVAIVLGMACGTMKFATAILACLFSLGIMWYLWYTNFGSRLRYHMVVNFHWGRPLQEMADLKALLHRHSLNAVCASQRTNEGFEGADLSYRLLLRDPEKTDLLLTELRGLRGVSRLTGLKAEEESEV